MITKASFKNLKLLRDVEFPLGRLNVIVGANGVGKSTALQGLNLLSTSLARLREDPAAPGEALSRLFSGSADRESLVSKPDADGFMIGVTLRDGDQVDLTVSAGVVLSLLNVGSFQFRRHGPSGGTTLDTRSTSGEETYRFTTEAERIGLGRWPLVRLDAQKLSASHHSAQRDADLGFDGEGLASVLQRIQIARDGRLERIESSVAAVVPHAKRIRTTQEPISVTEHVPVVIDGKTSFVSHQREHTGAGFEVEWGDVGWVNARHLSEGTLLVIGLATLLANNPPSLVLIDDLDKALHPLAQIEVVKMLQHFVDANPQVQVLATTHSPFVVDALQPEQVLVAGSIDARTTTILRLIEHPTWSKQKPYLKPGEFWSAVGESWVAEPKR